MMTYGVTSDGFVKKTLPVLKTEIQTSLLGLINSSLNLADTSVFGQNIGIFGDQLRQMWDVAEAVYRAAYPDSASGEALDQVGSITGAIRLGDTPSTVTLDRLFLDTGVTVTVDSIVSVGDTGARFVIKTAVVNSLGYPAIFSTDAESENTGPIVGYAETINAIQMPITGWFAKAAVTCVTAEPYMLDGRTLIIHGDVGVTQYITFAAGNPWSAAAVVAEILSQTTDIEAYDSGGYVLLASTTDGPGSTIECKGGTANAVLNFPTGLIRGFNSADAVTGTNLQLDPAFRIYREELLRVIGAATVEAIRARVRALSGVTQVYVFENVEITVSPDGLPGKSFEVVVLGGDEQEIADTIWLVKGAGIETYGSITKSITDSMGFTHGIEFSRPTDVPMYNDLTVQTDPATFPIDGVDQVKAALIAGMDLMQIGEDVWVLQFKCIPLSVAGVLDVTVFELDKVTPPVITSGSVAIGIRELASLIAGNINVMVI